MPRCVAPALATLASLAFAAPLAAQVRTFPATALRATMVVVQPPAITIDGEPARLSPGARIRGADNLLVLSAAVVGQPLVVHYTVEPQGLVHDIWILRPEELARRPWPTSREQALRWSFDPDAQVWTAR
jgi:hypothetical protein